MRPPIISEALLLLTAILLNPILHAQKRQPPKGNEISLQALLHYDSSRVPIVSGHRGGRLPGFPENSIEGLARVTEAGPVFFEIDPRLTKDSVMVLMHDATLDRTTNGTGKLSDYTWEELRKLRLKDASGQLTSFRIPLLQEVIDWARDRALLNLDHKDVPMAMTADIIRKNKAEEFVMVTVHSVSAARFYYESNPRIMMSAHIRSDSALQEFEKSGLPWRNFIAYIGPDYNEINTVIQQRLHQQGVMCMISAASSFDKIADPAARAAAYQKVFAQGADILESDYPIDVYREVSRKPGNQSR